MKRLFMALSIALFSAGLIALPGCDDDDTKTYDVTITWNIGNGLECTWSVQGGTLVELDDVTVSVYAKEGDEDPMDTPVTVSCDQFEYTIPRLSRGTYWVKVQAWGEYDGVDLPMLIDEKEIKAPHNDDHDNEFTLLLSPGDIKVSWRFANGYGCDYNGVTEVDIGITEVGNTWASEETECGPQQYTIRGKRAFSEYRIDVDGLDADGAVIFTGTYDGNPFLLLPGESRDVDDIVLDAI